MNTLKSMVLWMLMVGGLVALPVHAQEMNHEHHSAEAPGLSEPGQPIFGVVQEVIRRLEADSTTNWEDVDLEALRQHLIDMHQVALHVEVVYQYPIEGGIHIRVRPTTAAAAASLDRVLRAHPTPLKHETGWTMAVTRGDGYRDLRITTSEAAEVAKVRALGYIGILAHGGHHQQHHWMIATGQPPH